MTPEMINADFSQTDVAGAGRDFVTSRIIDE